MGKDIFQKLATNYPFITLCVYANEEYVGIIQNRDDAVTTIYDFGAVKAQEDKVRFLELANVWWWESNHSIPCVQPHRHQSQKIQTQIYYTGAASGLSKFICNLTNIA